MADLMIVDDDIDAGDLLAEVLRGEGHSVRVARNGLDGLTLLRDRRPAVVLLDVEMPRLTGPEMAYLMLVNDCGEEMIPLILLSGVVGLSVVAARVGTPYFLAKPYSIDSVLRIIDLALTERKPPNPEHPWGATP